MDTTEFNKYDSDHLHPGQFDLPEIRDIKIRSVNFKAPKFNNFESSLSKYTKAVEFTITTDKPIPPRSATPVLLIGNIRVSYYENGEKNNTYVFFALEPGKLKEGELIRWGWNNDPAERIKATKFYYKPPGSAK